MCSALSEFIDLFSKKGAVSCEKPRYPDFVAKINIFFGGGDVRINFLFGRVKLSNVQISICKNIFEVNVSIWSSEMGLTARPYFISYAFFRTGKIYNEIRFVTMNIFAEFNRSRLNDIFKSFDTLHKIFKFFSYTVIRKPVNIQISKIKKRDYCRNDDYR